MRKRYYTAESLDRAVREFEAEYGMSSAEFYERYKAGTATRVRRFDQHTWAAFHEDILRMTDGAGVERGSVASRAHEAAVAC